MNNHEEFARQRFEFNRQKQALQQMHQQRLTLAYRGGMFKVDLNLYSYLSMANLTVAMFKHEQERVLIDMYDTPIKCDVVEMLKLVDERYKEVTNDWLNEYEDLKTKRRVKDVAV
jgi:hypothetical protein|tara:strand:+ start:310 stop:654 length:345 start_codon:yes stop_codon:yes gene_type:complete